MSQLPHWLLFERGRPDHADKVKAGMELGSWQPTQSQWHDWLARRRKRVIQQLPGRFLAFWFVGLLGAIAMVSSYSVATELTVAIGCIAVPAFAVVAVVLMHALRRRARLKKLEEVEAPRIVLTSTGLLVGDLARAWHGDHTRLDHAEFDPDGPSLIVHFRTSSTLAALSTYNYALPMPATVAKQAADITRDINRLATSRPV